MIGQTIINVQAGGRLRVSGIIAAVVLLLLMLFLADALGAIPLAALVGVVIMIVIDTFEWQTFKWFFILPWMDSVIIIAVTVLAVVTDLATAVGVGIALQSLAFSWSASSRAKISSRQFTKRYEEDGTEVNVARYVMKGPLFFGSAELFQSRFVHMRSDPEEIVVHLDNVRVHDSSGLEALQNIAHRAALMEKKLTFIISENTKKFIDRSGDFLTSFDYVVSEENQYLVCPKTACERSCKIQRKRMCDCYKAFTGAFTKMWASMDECNRNCCHSCCTKCCGTNESCMKCVNKDFGKPPDEQHHQAKIVFARDDRVLKKFKIHSVFSSADLLSSYLPKEEELISKSV